MHVLDHIMFIIARMQEGIGMFQYVLKTGAHVIRANILLNGNERSFALPN